MSTFKTRPVGEIFEYRKMKLQVVEGETCEGCYFSSEKYCYEHIYIAGSCSDYYRDDNKNIIFKQIDE